MLIVANTWPPGHPPTADGSTPGYGGQSGKKPYYPYQDGGSSGSETMTDAPGYGATDPRPGAGLAAKREEFTICAWCLDYGVPRLLGCIHYSIDFDSNGTPGNANIGDGAFVDPSVAGTTQARPD